MDVPQKKKGLIRSAVSTSCDSIVVLVVVVVVAVAVEDEASIKSWVASARDASKPSAYSGTVHSTSMPVP
jgi:hypothetical protein